MRKVIMWGTGQDCKMRTTATEDEVSSLWINGDNHYYISLGESLLGTEKTQCGDGEFLCLILSANNKAAG